MFLMQHYIQLKKKKSGSWPVWPCNSKVRQKSTGFWRDFCSCTRLICEMSVYSALDRQMQCYGGPLPRSRAAVLHSWFYIW